MIVCHIYALKVHNYTTWARMVDITSHRGVSLCVCVCVWMYIFLSDDVTLSLISCHWACCRCLRGGCCPCWAGRKQSGPAGEGPRNAQLVLGQLCSALSKAKTQSMFDIGLVRKYILGRFSKMRIKGRIKRRRGDEELKQVLQRGHPSVTSDPSPPNVSQLLSSAWIQLKTLSDKTVT